MVCVCNYAYIYICVVWCVKIPKDQSWGISLLFIFCRWVWFCSDPFHHPWPLSRMTARLIYDIMHWPPDRCYQWTSWFRKENSSPILSLNFDLWTCTTAARLRRFSSLSSFFSSSLSLPFPHLSTYSLSAHGPKAIVVTIIRDEEP